MLGAEVVKGPLTRSRVSRDSVLSIYHHGTAMRSQMQRTSSLKVTGPELDLWAFGISFFEEGAVVLGGGVSRIGLRGAEERAKHGLVW